MEPGFQEWDPQISKWDPQISKWDPQIKKLGPAIDYRHLLGLKLCFPQLHVSPATGCFCNETFFSNSNSQSRVAIRAMGPIQLTIPVSNWDP